MPKLTIPNNGTPVTLKVGEYLTIEINGDCHWCHKELGNFFESFLAEGDYHNGDHVGRYKAKAVGCFGYNTASFGSADTCKPDTCADSGGGFRPPGHTITVTN
jgi:hypothetical protein